jgi:hypothetical protein
MRRPTARAATKAVIVPKVVATGTAGCSVLQGACKADEDRAEIRRRKIENIDHFLGMIFRVPARSD